MGKKKKRSDKVKKERKKIVRNEAPVHKHYKIENGKIERINKTCPKCGPGVYLAEHKDRRSCGKCGYSEMK